MYAFFIHTYCTCSRTASRALRLSADGVCYSLFANILFSMRADMQYGLSTQLQVKRATNVTFIFKMQLKGNSLYEYMTHTYIECNIQSDRICFKIHSALSGVPVNFRHTRKKNCFQIKQLPSRSKILKPLWL